MDVKAWSGLRLLQLWGAGVIVSACTFVAGRALRPQIGAAAGFAVESLLFWIMWAPIIVTWRWLGARERPTLGWRASEFGMAALTGVWILGTFLDCAVGLL